MRVRYASERRCRQKKLHLAFFNAFQKDYDNLAIVVNALEKKAERASELLSPTLSSVEAMVYKSGISSPLKYLQEQLLDAERACRTQPTALASAASNAFALSEYFITIRSGTLTPTP